jgi:hypothetical protein
MKWDNHPKYGDLSTIQSRHIFSCLCLSPVDFETGVRTARRGFTISIDSLVYPDVQKRYADTPETLIGDPEIDFFFVRLFRHYINI